jgi:hypothetical protein
VKAAGQCQVLDRGINPYANPTFPDMQAMEKEHERLNAVMREIVALLEPVAGRVTD